MLALYRKYRPQTFGDVVSQEHVTRILQNQIKSGSPGHAYLFAGPRGLGKTTCARLLAKALNCQSRKEAEPCNTCASCQAVLENRHLDVIEMDAASHTGVDNVRENIIAAARVPPVEGIYKVFIIDEAHMLSTSAFAALLKLMEEPPAHTIFVLATTELEKVPETIRSRCQRFDFKKIGMEKMIQRLRGLADAEEKKISENVLREIAHLSGGCLRDAETLLGQLLALGEKGKGIADENVSLVLPRSNLAAALYVLEATVVGEALKAVQRLETLHYEGADLDHFLKTLLELSRRLLLASLSPQLLETLPALGGDIETRLLNLAKQIKPNDVSRLIDTLLKACENLKFTDLPVVALEAAVINFSKNSEAAGVPPPAEAVAGLPVRQSEGEAARGERVNNADHTPREWHTPGSGYLAAEADPLTLDEVRDKWDVILSDLKVENYPLAALLRLGELRQVAGRNVEVAFKYKFYYARAADQKNRTLFETIAGRHLNGQIRLEVKFEAPATIAPAGPIPSTVQALAQEFGGEVI